MRDYFSDKQAVITGASSGIGAEFAGQLVARGASVTLVARRERLLAELVERLNQTGQGQADHLSLDLTSESDMADLVERLRTTQVDILINNAGRGSFGCYEDLSIDSEVEQVVLNAIAPMRLTHAVIPQMKARESGAIVFVSSVAGFNPLPYMATYAATKSFNLSQALALRSELRPYGVRVLAVCPGPTATEFGGVARIPGKITGLARDSVEMVVAESLSALQNNQAWVAPGWRTLGMVWSSWLLPMSLTSALVGRKLKPVLDLVNDRRAGESDE